MANKNSILSVAASVSKFLVVAGMDEASEEAQVMTNTFMQIGLNDANQIPDILACLDASRTELEKAIGMSKSAEFPFAKKDEPKNEPKLDGKDDAKKEEPKDDKKPGFPPKKEDKKPNPFEKKDDKKEEPKAEPKKEEHKSEPKHDGPKEEHHDEHKDESEAKEAIELLEKLLADEEKEGEPAPHLTELKDALKLVREFLLEEEGEMHLPGMDGLPGLGMPGLGKPNPLDMKDPHKMDIQVAGPAMPLPAPKPEPALGLDKNLHPLDAKPLGPKVVKPPVLNKPPMANKPPQIPPAIHASLKVNDRVWTKTAGAEYEIDDEPGRIVAIANDVAVVDWGNDAPCEEKIEDLVVAKTMNGEGTMFDAPPALTPEQEVVAGMNAFTPTSQEVQKALSTVSFADAMASHIKALADEQKGPNTVTIGFSKQPKEEFPFEIN